MTTDVVNIYGQIDNLSEVVLGIGNYNNVFGLLTLEEDNLSMKLLSELLIPNIVELILEYSSEHLFTLAIKNTDKYIGVKSETSLNHVNGKVLYTCISDTKTYFSINYSSIDRVSRSNIFSGALYSLFTIVDGIKSYVSWKFNGLPYSDLILFLPLSWYGHDTCENKTGLITLVENLNQLRFKGYTNEQWCKNIKHVIHCNDEQRCGNCLGYCDDDLHICKLDDNNNFICESTIINTTNDQTNYTWLAVLLTIIIILFLWWALS